MSYIYMSNERYEILENSKGACYVKDLTKNKFYYKEALYASKQDGFKKKILSWNLKDTIYLILIILSFIFVMILISNYKDFTYLHLSTNMKIEALLFLVGNLLIHELGHTLTLKYFGRSRGEYKFKIAFIFPTLSVDTSELYLLPKFEKICVCYAGIMNNIILCGLTVSIFPEYSYLIICVIPLIIFNSLPFGGVQTDGYHIIINQILDIKNYKNKEGIVCKMFRYLFYIVSIVVLFMTIKSFVG